MDLISGGTFVIKFALRLDLSGHYDGYYGNNEVKRAIDGAFVILRFYCTVLWLLGYQLLKKPSHRLNC